MKKLISLPLNRQVYLTFGVLCLFLVLIGGLLFFSLLTIERRNHQLQFEVSEQRRLSTDISKNAALLQAEVLRHVVITNPASIQAHDQVIAAIRQSNTEKLTEYKKLIHTPDDQRLHISAVQARGKFWSATDALLQLGRAKDDSEKLLFVVSIQAPAYDEYRRALEEMSASAEKIERRMAAATAGMISRIRIIADDLLAVAIVITILAALSVLKMEGRLKEDNRGLQTTISRLKSAEAALRESETRLRAIFEAEPECVKVVSREGALLEMNPAGLVMLQARSLAEAQQTALADYIVPEHRAAFRALHDRVMAGEPGILEFELIGLKGGRRWLESHVTPLRNSAGVVQSLLGITRDITERRQSQSALRASEERYRTLFECSPDGILITDPQNRYLGANPSICRMLGYSAGELIGLHASAVMDQTEIAHIRHGLSELNEACGHQWEWRFRRKDASQFTADVLATLMPDGNVLGMIRDVTPRKEIEAQNLQLNAELEARVAERTAELQVVNRELEAFSYSVSHDLRAPLRQITGFVKLLQKDAGPALSEKSVRFLTTVSESAQRMGVLIDDLLAFSQIGRSTLQKNVVNLDQLTRETVAEFQLETKAHPVKWLIDPLPTVWADRSLLRMVLLNLISNAVKFTGARPEPRIEIGCAPNGSSETVIYIRDNGAGFNPEYAAKLFGVFQRLHSQAEFEGTGIGLANVQRIINRHGGRAWAEGVEHAGAVFYFSLPNQPEGNHEH